MLLKFVVVSLIASVSAATTYCIKNNNHDLNVTGEVQLPSGRLMPYLNCVYNLTFAPSTYASIDIKTFDLTPGDYISVTNALQETYVFPLLSGLAEYKFASVAPNVTIQIRTGPNTTCSISGSISQQAFPTPEGFTLTNETLTPGQQAQVITQNNLPAPHWYAYSSTTKVTLNIISNDIQTTKSPNSKYSLMGMFLFDGDPTGNLTLLGTLYGLSSNNAFISPSGKLTLLCASGLPHPDIAILVNDYGNVNGFAEYTAIDSFGSGRFFGITLNATSTSPAALTVFDPFENLTMPYIQSIRFTDPSATLKVFSGTTVSEYNTDLLLYTYSNVNWNSSFPQALPGGSVSFLLSSGSAIFNFTLNPYDRDTVYGTRSGFIATNKYGLNSTLQNVQFQVMSPPPGSILLTLNLNVSRMFDPVGSTLLVIKDNNAANNVTATSNVTSGKMYSDTAQTIYVNISCSYCTGTLIHFSAVSFSETCGRLLWIFLSTLFVLLN